MGDQLDDIRKPDDIQMVIANKLQSHFVANQTSESHMQEASYTVGGDSQIEQSQNAVKQMQTPGDDQLPRIAGADHQSFIDSQQYDPSSDHHVRESQGDSTQG